MGRVAVAAAVFAAVMGSAAAAQSLCGDISAPTVLKASEEYTLDCQVFVKDGFSLTIEAGTTIKAATGQTPAPALVVERGAKIYAEGTKDKPITFTTAQEVDPSSETFNPVNVRGLWGGLIILGKAPIQGTEDNVEGLSGHPYGGSDAADNSGSLKYVRVWYGGSVIGENNEINGITLAGVGSGTTIEHIEVAYNLDDGVEFFGGTANAKYVSVLFCGDDGIDTDQGYQGKIQFALVMVGTQGNHATEMDSNGSELDKQPRSFPQVYNFLAVGGDALYDPPSTDDVLPALMRLREGTGGEFGNIILTNVGKDSYGVRETDCGSEARTHTKPSSGAKPDYLWFSSNSIISGGDAFQKDSTCAGLSQAAQVDPQLVLMPAKAHENVTFVDPRPKPASAAWSSHDTVPSDGFFTSVNYRGAFGEELWLAGWSWLSDNGRIPDDRWGTFLGGDISADTTWDKDTTYLMTSQVFVKSGTTLFIDAGATIYAYSDDGAGVAPALVVERGAKIVADGSASMPVTLTSALPASQLPVSGVWGGLIICGKAPITGNGEDNVEGLSGHPYGGSDAADNSGSLKYVRVWYGGSVIGANNEINGITLAGVGSGTTIEHIEVAYNLDDGVEFFGGTVNAKYVSVLFCGDDGIDTDQGYQGKIQFAFVVVGEKGHHGVEMDSKTTDKQPRSFPQLYNALFVGGAGDPNSVSSDDQIKGMMRLRENTGGEFGNIMLVNVPGVGVYQNDCGSETRTHTKESSGAKPDYLWWSSNNLMVGATTKFDLQSGCVGLSESMTATDAELMLLPTNMDEQTKFIDPRPKSGSVAYSNVDTLPSDGFFSSVSYKGAFGESLWIAEWSILSEQGKIPRDIYGTVIGGNLESSMTLSGSTTYLLTSQLFVKDGVTLTVGAGTTIYAYGDDGTGKAPAIVVERGAKISASGSVSSPITMTSAVSDSILPKAGMWGGLIICGKAPVIGSEETVEGLTGVKYGGDDAADNSGTLKYVRVWYGGSVIGANNEINGITFAGVGSGTTVERIEVAFNLDDGVEFFGGTVNVKYVSVAFCGDDGIDTDTGYQGKIQFAFVVVDMQGHHGAEMDSKTTNKQPRSFPQVYNALFVGSQRNTPGSISSDDQLPAILRLRENTGGEFGNVILTNVASYGVYQNDCGSETRTHTKPTSGSPDYLWWSSNNIVYGPGQPFRLQSGCDGFTSASRVNPMFLVMPTDAEHTEMFDPRPRSDSPVFDDYDTAPSDGFFTVANYRGAFSHESDAVWIATWTWLAENGRLADDILAESQSGSSSDDNTAEIAIAVVCAIVAVAALAGCAVMATKYRQTRADYSALLEKTKQSEMTQV